MSIEFIVVGFLLVLSSITTLACYASMVIHRRKLERIISAQYSELYFSQGADHRAGPPARQVIE